MVVIDKNDPYVRQFANIPLVEAMNNDDVESIKPFIKADPSLLVELGEQTDPQMPLAYQHYAYDEIKPTCLLHAIKENRTKCIEYLLTVPEQVEKSVDTLGRNMLHYLAIYSSQANWERFFNLPEFVKLRRSVDNNGETALILSLRFRSPHFYDLAQYENDIKNKIGQTPLIVTVVAELPVMFKNYFEFLCKHEDLAKNEFGVFDNNRKTAIMYALTTPKKREAANLVNEDVINFSPIRLYIMAPVISALLHREEELKACSRNEEGSVVADCLLTILNEYQDAKFNGNKQEEYAARMCYPACKRDKTKVFRRMASIYKYIYSSCEDVTTAHKAVAGGILGLNRDEYDNSKEFNFEPTNLFESVLFDTLGYPIFTYTYPCEF